MEQSNTPRHAAEPPAGGAIFVKPKEPSGTALEPTGFQARVLRVRGVVRWLLVPCAVLAALSPVIAHQYPDAVVLSFAGFLGGLGLFAVGLLALSGTLSIICGLWKITGPRSAIAMVVAPLVAVWGLVDGPMWMASGFDVRTVEGTVTDVYVGHLKQSDVYTVYIDGKEWSAQDRAGKAVKTGDRVSCRYTHAPAVIADELIDCEQQ